jgi:pimeloyl-ACP methyl ester carboxylesterase
MTEVRRMADMPSVTLYAQTLRADHAETIVFLPGFAGSHDVWNHDFHALSAQYRLIFIDTLGFGLSPKPEIAYSIDDHIAAISATLQSLGVRRSYVVGHSMGCLLALAFADRFPERVTKLALLALPYFQSETEARATIQQTSWFNRWLALDNPLAHTACALMCRMRPTMMLLAPLLSPDVPAVVARDALRHTWTSYSRTLRNVIFRARPQEWLRTIPQPILIVQGTDDQIAPITSVRRGIASLANVRLIALAAGHRLIFTHSGVIAREIMHFLQEPTVAS